MAFSTPERTSQDSDGQGLDNNPIDFAGPDVCHEPLQPRTFHWVSQLGLHVSGKLRLSNIWKLTAECRQRGQKI